MRQRELRAPVQVYVLMEQAILAIGIPALVSTGALLLWVCFDIWRLMRRPDGNQ